ncbi:MAG: hypothetical protein AAB669_02790 [Patescibacteria group bacterium]
MFGLRLRTLLHCTQPFPGTASTIDAASSPTDGEAGLEVDQAAVLLRRLAILFQAPRPSPVGATILNPI